MQINRTYCGQNKCNSWNGDRFEHICENHTFIAFVLKLHHINGLLDDRVVIHPLLRFVSIER